MKKKSLISITVFTAIAVAAFYFGKRIDTTTICPDYVLIDTLSQEIAKRDAEISSLKSELLALEEKQAGYVAQLDKQGKQLKVSKLKADTYASLYEQAKSDKDTVVAMAACDSVISEYATYKEACEDYVITADSIISVMYVRIDRDKQIIANQEKTIQTCRLGIIENRVDALTYKRKRNKWRAAAIIVATALGVSLIAN